MGNKISVIIPAYREPYLGKTVQSLLDNAEGEVEIIPVFDGEESLDADKSLWTANNPRVKIVLIEHAGMRAAINAGIKASKGEWIMKTDAHCVFAPGWDTTMTKETQVDWLMIPRRYSVDEKTWDRNLKRPVIDYHYLSFPGDETRSDPKYGYSFQVMNTVKREVKEIDDTMAFQGSCWFADREYFMKHIYPLDDKNYGSFAQ